MQVMPTTAGDKNVAIKDIHLVEPNIHAGVKYMRFLVNQYFDEPGIDSVNRHLFAFAAYNGGPNRIARLRKRSRRQGARPEQVVQQRRSRWSPRTSAAKPCST